jgi:hypothetical protein
VYKTSGSKLFSHSERSRALYRHARDRGRRGQFWSMLARRSGCLLDLKRIKANCEARTCCEAGRRTVPIAQIGGSEGRAGDFDRDWNPLQDHTRERWLSIAAARERGETLPPVSLVQVEDTYFVKDGHHRISVARAFGQNTIEAQVVVWQVAGPLSWEASTGRPRCEAVGQPTEISGATSRLRREGARLQDRVLLTARGLLPALRMALGSPTAERVRSRNVWPRWA